MIVFFLISLALAQSIPLSLEYQSTISYIKEQASLDEGRMDFLQTPLPPLSPKTIHLMMKHFYSVSSPELISISSSRSSSPREQLLALRFFPKVKELHLDSITLDESDCRILAQNIYLGLEDIKFHNVELEGESSIEILSNALNKTSLYAVQFYKSASVIPLLAMLRIQLSILMIINSGPNSISLDEIFHQNPFPFLVLLAVKALDEEQSISISDETFNAISRMENLKVLALENCTIVPGTRLELRFPDSLRELSMLETRIEEHQHPSVRQSILSLTRLKKLSIGSNRDIKMIVSSNDNICQLKEVTLICKDQSLSITRL